MDLDLEQLKERYQSKALDELDKEAEVRQKAAEYEARKNAMKSEIEEASQEYTYAFPAVRGVQAGREFYSAIIPYRALLKLFVFDDEVIPAEFRAQRVLNEKHAQGIGHYIASNLNDYVLPALTASVSSEMFFEPCAVRGASDRLGVLNIPFDATLLINDGQHRRKGIEHALKRNPELKDETVAVTLFFDHGLQRSQQMFADINTCSKKPSSAISMLYDKRNPFNAWVLSVLDAMPEIHRRIDFEKNSIGNKTLKLWSIISFKKFISQLTGITEKNIASLPGGALLSYENVIIKFFVECKTHIPNWELMLTNKLLPWDVRNEMVIGHAVFLEALGMFGRRLLPTDHSLVSVESFPWGKIECLNRLDPDKLSTMWEGRAVVLGKMQKTTDGIRSTASQLFKLADLLLTPEMSKLEAQLESLKVA